MTDKSDFETLVTGEIFRYLERIVKVRKFEDGYILTTTPKTMSLWGKTPIGGTGFSALISITLLSARECTWIVNELEFGSWVSDSNKTHSTQNPPKIYPGWAFLAFNRKRLPGGGSMHHPNNTIWTITCADDLRKLLKSYDQVANDLGFVTLFS